MVNFFGVTQSSTDEISSETSGIGNQSQDDGEGKGIVEVFDPKDEEIRWDHSQNGFGDEKYRKDLPGL